MPCTQLIAQNTILGSIVARSILSESAMRAKAISHKKRPYTAVLVLKY
jgi:hypothetical protein